MQESLAFSHAFWAAIYGTEYFDEAYSVAFYDGDPVVLCQVGECPVMMRLDGAGANVEWAFKYASHEHQELRALEKTGDGRLIAVGATTYDTKPRRLWAFALDPESGDVGPWEYVYELGDGDYYYTIAYDVAVGPDGSLFLTGALVWAAEDPNWPYYDAFIIRLDSDGHPVWAALWGSLGSYESGRRIATTPEGDVVVLGSAGSGFLVPSFIMVLDGENGGLKWANIYDDAYLYDVTITPEGYIVAVGRYQEGVLIIKVKPDGSQATYTLFTPSEGYAIGRAVAVMSGARFSNLVITGETTASGLGGQDLLLMCVRSDCSPSSLLWARAYGGEEGDWGYAVAVHEADDHYSIAVAGVTSSFNADLTDVFVLKVDEDGEIQDCPHVKDVSLEAYSISLEKTPISGLTRVPVTRYATTTEPVELELNVKLICVEDHVPPLISLLLKGEVVWINELNPALRQLIEVIVNASDNMGIMRVDLFIDGEEVSTSQESTLSYTWDTTEEEDGQHVLMAVAYDVYGNKANETLMAVVDNTPPEIESVAQAPTEPSEGEDVVIEVEASDATTGVKSARLFYRVNGGAWSQVEMKLEGGVWRATIPGQPAGAKVEYKVDVLDLLENRASSTVYSYVVKAGGGLFGLGVWHIAAIAVGVAVVVAIVIFYIRRK